MEPTAAARLGRTPLTVRRCRNTSNSMSLANSLLRRLSSSRRTAEKVR
jgi:hypothetical protein